MFLLFSFLRWIVRLLVAWEMDPANERRDESDGELFIEVHRSAGEQYVHFSLLDYLAQL